MAGQDNLSIARSLFDSFNNRDLEGQIKHYDKNADIIDVPSNTTLKGQEGLKQLYNGWISAFPDAKCTIKNSFASGDLVVVEFNAQGTQSGTLRTPEGDISPTNKKVNLDFCNITKFRNGKIISDKTYYDIVTMLKQLGVVPELRHH